MSKTKATVRRRPDWAAIRLLYESGAMAVGEIAALHGVSRSSIGRRCRAEGWAGRRQSVAGPKSMARALAGSRPRPDLNLIGRLIDAVDRNLKLMEMRMETEEPGTAADRERDTRAIGVLTRTLGKITELQSDAETNAPKSSQGSAAAEEDAERLRLEVAERILRLRERHQPG